jgi:hypothetical protein
VLLLLVLLVPGCRPRQERAVQRKQRQPQKRRNAQELLATGTRRKLLEREGTMRKEEKKMAFHVQQAQGDALFEQNWGCKHWQQWKSWSK